MIAFDARGGNPESALVSYLSLDPRGSVITPSPSSLRTVEPDAPVFEPARFIGRAGLVDHLVARCRAGQLALLHARWVLERQRTSARRRPAVQYLDLADETLRCRWRLAEWERVPVLLLDHCDELRGMGAMLAEKMTVAARRDAAGQAIVWAGGRAWYEHVIGAKATLGLQSAPLAVLFGGTARL